MRKNIIALMLILPILFVLVVYSAVNAASLDVRISVNGIEIMERYPGDAVSIDLASYDNSYEITPSVLPANASNKEFEYRYERISGSATDDEVAAGKVVEVVNEGGVDKIKANAVGTVRIVAVSKDGGYEDSVTAIVGSSKPYAFDFSMYNGADKQNVLTETEWGYTAELSAGQYGFAIKLKPGTHLSPEFEVEEGFIKTDVAGGTVTLPFTGKTSFKVSIPNGAKGVLEKRVELNVTNESLGSGNFSVNGSTDSNILINFDGESRRVDFFVEAPVKPQVTCYEQGATVSVTRVNGTINGWSVGAELPAGDNFTFEVSAAGVTKTVRASAAKFDFIIRTDIPGFDASGGVDILMGTPVSFYAKPTVVATGITYQWDFINVGDMNDLSYETNADGSVCTVTANARDKFIIVVEARRDNGEIVNMDAHEVEVEVINNVIGIQSVNTQLGLAKSRAVAGWKYENGEKVKNIFPVSITAYSPSGALADGINDLDFALDSRTAAIVTEGGGPLVKDECIFLEIRGKGKITLTASWKGNEEWRSNEPYTEISVPLIVDSEAVEVTTSSTFFAETVAGNPVVLGADIMLGADDSGAPLPIETRRSMLKRMRSTYNTDYYTKSGAVDSAYVNYVVEFTNDLYGNGYSVCGEYFSNETDATGKPLLFTGPLNLVSLGEFASVAAQDNIVYLCRTDGVTLYNATLLGCSDSSRTNPGTKVDDLTLLNNTGTVLDINADVNVLNCRVRNGRNVVRVYGGNRNGENYFIDNLSENVLTAEDRAVVRIEGCVLSHSREFVLKTGANRALRATVRLGMEPLLTGRSGNYESQNDDYVNDDYFYNTYVLTDVTLSDSVLEKSGLFCVGVEANFAGEMLWEGSRYATDSDFADFLGPWAGVGGTSFATMLKLAGNVRMYDWKDLNNINSDTLIQSSVDDFPLKLDLAAMIDYMCASNPDFNTLIDEEDGCRYVHGGIALYGGGRNYCQVSLSKLDSARATGLKEFKVNISELEGAEGDAGGIGSLLPRAAGSQDFRFFMYESTSPNNRSWQSSADYSVTPLFFI